MLACFIGAALCDVISMGKSRSGRDDDVVVICNWKKLGERFNDDPAGRLRLLNTHRNGRARILLPNIMDLMAEA